MAKRNTARLEPWESVGVGKIPAGIRLSTKDDRHATRGPARRANGTPKKSYVSSDKPAGFTPDNGTGKRRSPREMRARERRHARRRLAAANAMNGM